jgi:hypothetical protein
MIRVLAVVATVVLFIGPAQAQGLSGHLQSFTTQMEKGQAVEAVGSLRQAMAEAWNKLPLTIKRALLVEQKAGSYANFQARPNNLYAKDQPVLIYVEPICYHFKPQGGGVSFGLAVDLTLLDKAGKVLGGQRDFGKWTFEGREPVFEFYMNLTVNVTVEPGEYLLEITTRDLASPNQTSFQLPVVFQ